MTPSEDLRKSPDGDHEWGEVPAERVRGDAPKFSRGDPGDEHRFHPCSECKTSMPCSPLARCQLLAGGRHPNSARFHNLLKELGALHDQKQKDYGSDTDPFANVRQSQDWGIPAWVGALVRLNDKVKRLQSFAKKGSLANESAEDSMRDIAVYAIIALVLYEQEGECTP